MKLLSLIPTGNFKLLFAIIAICFISSCQKDFTIDDDLTPPTPVVVVDDAVKVNASVNGVVLDENKNPVAGAIVKCGTASTTTNSLGIFFFKNIDISKHNGSVAVIKSGYFNATRSFVSSAGKSHHVKIQLLQKTVSGTLDAAAGAIVNLNGGATITFPANAFATASGTTYVGPVTVYGYWINPTAPNLPLIIPGDLRGVRNNGSEVILSTYGMVGAEFTDASGNTLKIASGKTAEISFPIPASLQSSAPAQVPLWHFDETKARWIEEGSTTKTGNVYKATVNKFSFWNVDVPFGMVTIKCTFIDQLTNYPIANELVVIKSATYPNISSYGYTNSQGYVSGGVFANEPLIMELHATNSCGTVLFTSNIGPFAQDTDLDTIKVNLSPSLYTVFTGQIADCSGNPLQNAYLSFYAANYGAYIVEPNSSGNFSFLLSNCPGNPLSYSYHATNTSTQQQSEIYTGTVTSSPLNIGTILACTATAPTVDVYVAGSESSNGGKSIVKLWKNGVASNITDGSVECFASSVFIDNDDVYIAGNRSNASSISSAVFWKNGVETYIGGGGSDAYAQDIFVQGSDVYVANFGYNAFTGISSARLWKNGTNAFLSDQITNAYANAVYVSGADVYVGGYQTNSAGKNVAIIWKNGVAINLSNGTFDAQVNKIFVNGADVYAVGQEKIASGKGKAVLWKNGVVSNITDGINTDAMANGIFVVGTDVYVCGRQAGTLGEKAMLWKNGVATALTVNNGNGVAKNVFVKNNDVYVTENAFLSGPSRLWKNNVPTNLTTGQNFNLVSGIFVK